MCKIVYQCWRYAFLKVCTVRIKINMKCVLRVPICIRDGVLVLILVLVLTRVLFFQYLAVLCT